MTDARSRIRGCLLGGAVGDALGAPVEFLSMGEIREAFGAEGVRDYAPAYGRASAITDDTQMTLFTAEGLVRAHVAGAPPGPFVHHAYLRWLLTQGVRPRASVAADPRFPDGWLVEERALWARRAPGNTCVSALRASTELGERAQNDSKGCGTVMRVAPIGLVLPSRAPDGGMPPFDLGVETSAYTHGHPAGTLSGGAMALLVARLMEGLELPAAVDALQRVLDFVPGAAVVREPLLRAIVLASEGDPTPEKVESLGGAWVAEEALAIAVYAALVAEGFEHGVLLAVNHSGDSDSTGSMVGQLLGAAWGHEAIPARWLADLELRDAIDRMAEDLCAIREGTMDTSAEGVRRRYPAW